MGKLVRVPSRESRNFHGRLDSKVVFDTLIPEKYDNYFPAQHKLRTEPR
jgi:hypothetical protein